MRKTWFFRDAEPFAGLAEHGRSAEPPLRLLSAPCLTGEEPYSMAIALLEAGVDQFSIDAVDINPRALRVAQRAVYTDDTFPESGERIPERLLEKYFRAVEGGFEVSPQVRARVKFRQADLFHPGTLKGTYDVIFCRYLLHRLNKEAQRQLIAITTAALSPDGVLFAGTFELLRFLLAGGLEDVLHGLACRRAKHPTYRISEKRLDEIHQRTRVYLDAAWDVLAKLEFAEYDELYDPDSLEDELLALKLAMRKRGSLANPVIKRGYYLDLQGRHHEAIDNYERAIRIDPECYVAHRNLALSLLQVGDFERGWRENEWHWKREWTRRFTQPRWYGQPLAGRTILLHDGGREGLGLGDAIQFARYLPLVRERAGRTLLEADARLAPLLRPLVDVFIPIGDPLPSFDFYAPLLGLPYVFKTTLDNIPAPLRYVGAPALGGFAHEQRLKVGLAWAACGQHDCSRYRSIPFREFGRLSGLENVAFFNLQRGQQTDPSVLKVAEIHERSADLTDAAAAILSLDLVITADTMIAHLAGTLGRRVWVLLAFVAEFRWMVDRDDSPWYPTMRLYRQTRRGDWGGVIERVLEDLRRELWDFEGRAAQPGAGEAGKAA